ncbi:MAG: MFS transporter [Candidatus Helarchaeota archaeon]|nr:MFS transporter [Candidatus Helarchaeota archaeon]
MENKISKKLSNKQMLGYAFGAIPGALLGFIFVMYYVEFFYDDLKLLPIYFITGLIIYAIVNAINDPLLGHLSDRTDRKRWGGRRIPFIKYGAPIWALAFIMTWFPWSFDNQIIIFIHFIVSICSFDTMLTLVILCWMALVPEMTSDIDERNKINFLTTVIGLIGLLPFFIIVPAVKEAGLQPFQFVNIIVGIISVICYLIVAKTNKEKPEFQKDEVFPLVKSIKETVKLKSFLFFIGYNFCGVIKGAMALSYIFVYALIFGGYNMTTIVLFLLTYIPVSYIGSITCIHLRPKWGMRKIILRFGLLQVIGSFTVFFIIINPQTESLIWLGFIWMTFFGGYGIFTVPMMALSMDEDEVNQGTRREGMFLGINALFTKPADSLGPIIATIMLETFGYLKSFLLMPDSPFQFTKTLFGIKILFLIIPAIISLISFIFMYFYPLHSERLKELQTKLEELHQKKREQFASNLST